MHIRRRSLRVALVAALLVLLWQALTVHYNYRGNWTALFRTGSLVPVPPQLAPSTYIFQGSIGYDGQFYRYVARDPSPTGKYAEYVDDPRRRFQRILLPALAHLTGYSDSALIALVSLFSGLGVYWTARYLASNGVRAEWGLLFLFMPATLTSVDRILLDGALLALFAGFVLYVEEERWRALLLVCIAAPLVRDTGMILPASVVVQMLWKRDWRKAALFAASTVPSLAWWGYVASVTPPTSTVSVFGWPLVGIVLRLFSPRSVPDALTQAILRLTDGLALLGLLAAFYLGVRELAALRTKAAQVAVSSFLALGLVLTGTSILTDPYSFSRPVSPLLLTLTIAALCGRSRWNLFPPAAMAAAVGIYLISPTLAILRGLAGVAR